MMTRKGTPKELLDALLGDEVADAYYAAPSHALWATRHRLLQLPAVQGLIDEYLYGCLQMNDIDEWCTALLKENFEAGEQFGYGYALGAIAVVLEPAAIEGDDFARGFLRSLAGMGIAETRREQLLAQLCLKGVFADEQES